MTDSAEDRPTISDADRAEARRKYMREYMARRRAATPSLPRDGEDYPLWLLLATKKALFCGMEDPELEDARYILEEIDEALNRNHKKVARRRATKKSELSPALDQVIQDELDHPPASIVGEEP